MHVSEGQLYAATVADFSGGEPLIHREKIRTERSDLNQLNGKNPRKYGVRCFAILQIHPVRPAQTDPDVRSNSMIDSFNRRAYLIT